MKHEYDMKYSFYRIRTFFEHEANTKYLKKNSNIKMGEMQKVSEVFKLNLNYYQRVAHKKLS